VNLISLFDRCFAGQISRGLMPEFQSSPSFCFKDRGERVQGPVATRNGEESLRATNIPTCAIGLFVALALFSVPALAHISPCDLNKDGKITTADVQLAINMVIGSTPCTANIAGAGVCNAAIVRRVINAALGQACNTGGGAVPHSVSLRWIASDSLNIAGYNVYRGSAPGGPYTKITSALAGTSYTDGTVSAGQTYYYVCTAVDTSNNESAYSSSVKATIPSP
jgi:hypothetical protein